MKRLFWPLVAIVTFVTAIFAGNIAGFYMESEGPARDVAELVVRSSSFLGMLIAFAMMDIIDRIDKR